MRLPNAKRIVEFMPADTQFKNDHTSMFAVIDVQGYTVRCKLNVINSGTLT